MIDLENYIAECNRMAMLKLENPDIAKVYSDVNFFRMIDKARELQQYFADLELAEELFGNVSH